MKIFEYVLTNKLLSFFIFIIIVSSFIIIILNPYQDEYIDKYPQFSIAQKMAKIDKNQYLPSSYQTLLDDIQRECPRHTQEQIGDMIAYIYSNLRKKGIKDTFYETLIGIKESVQNGVCKQFELEAIVAGYLVVRAHIND